MPDDEGLRVELAEALRHRPVHAPWRSRRLYGDRDGGYYALDETSVQGLVADLLPVVERYAARRAAEALREAATAYYREPRVDVHDWLWDTADALAADGAEPHPAHRHDETGAGRG